MPGKDLRRETPSDRPAAKDAVPLCRYEELAMRENRLRQSVAAKRKAKDQGPLPEKTGFNRGPNIPR